MVIECLAIFGIIFAVMMICIFKKDEENDRKNAKLVVPLLILPGAHIIAYFGSEWISMILPLDYFLVYLLIDTVALVTSGILVGVFAKYIEAKGNKIAYGVIALIYNLVLSYFLMYELLLRLYAYLIENYDTILASVSMP